MEEAGRRTRIWAWPSKNLFSTIKVLESLYGNLGLLKVDCKVLCLCVLFWREGL